MCWNENVSLNTFLFSSFVLLLIMYNNAFTQYKIKELNNVYIYIFTASVIFMQLIEFFIWRNLNNKHYNKLFTTIAALLIIVQPFVSIMIISNKLIRNIFLVICSLSIIPYSFYNYSKLNIQSGVSNNGHLDWKFINGTSPLFWAAWFFFFLISWFYEKKWFIFGILIISIAISYYTYNKYNTFSSMWCWIVNSIMIYYAFYLLFYLPFNEKGDIC